MLLTIHNLPSSTRYTDVKSLIQSRCGLSEILLDNLVNEDEGQSKKVTLGVAEEEDAAIVVRQINGLFVNGKQLYVEKVRQKKVTEQPYRVEQPYRASEPVGYQNNPVEQSSNLNMDSLPNVPVALNLGYPQMTYNQQALVQDPMMQMMLAQQMMGMFMLPQQNNLFMGNSGQAPSVPEQLPSSSHRNNQNQNAGFASEQHSTLKEDNRYQNKNSQMWRDDDGHQNSNRDQGFNRPYERSYEQNQQENNSYNPDRRNQPPKEDRNQRNSPNERNKPCQGFNRPDDQHGQSQDHGNQRPWSSDRNQPGNNRTAMRWQPDNYRDEGPSRNRSRSPRTRNTYNAAPQRYQRETNYSGDYKDNHQQFEGNERYDQAPKRVNDEPKETWNRRNAPPEKQSLVQARDIPPHQSILQAAREYYEPAQSFSQNDSYSSNRSQAREPRKRSYLDSDVGNDSQHNWGQPTRSSLGNNSRPSNNRENSIQTPAFKFPPQKETPNYENKRQKIEPPPRRNAPLKSNAPPSGIPSLMSLAPPRGIAPLIAPARGNPTPQNDNVPRIGSSSLNEKFAQIRNVPRNNSSSKYKRNSYPVKIERASSFRLQAAAQIGKAIFTKCKGKINPLLSYQERDAKLLKALKVAVHTRIELLMSNELEVPIVDIVDRYRKRFPWKDDQNLYLAVVKNFDDEASTNDTKAQDVGPVQMKKEISETDVKKEMPVPKQEKPESTAKLLHQPQKGPASAPRVRVRKPKMVVGKLPDYFFPERTAKKKAFIKDVDKCDPLVQDALEKELDAIYKVFMSQCKGAANKKEAIIETRIGTHTSKSFRQALKEAVVKRLLEYREVLEVRVAISGKIPPPAALNKFLRPYGVVSIKLEKTIASRPYYIAICQDYNKYEELCLTGSAVMNPQTTLLFKPKLNAKGATKNAQGTNKNAQGTNKNAPTSQQNKNVSSSIKVETVDLSSEHDEEKSVGEKKDEELFYLDIPEVKPTQESHVNNDEEETNNVDSQTNNADTKPKIEDKNPNDADTKPNDEDTKPNDEDTKPNNEDTNTNDDDTSTNDENAKEVFMLDGEEYEVEDEDFDVKDSDLEDF